MSLDAKPSSPAPSHAVAPLAAAACLASLLLYAPTLWRPALLQDDFQILEQSWTWERTRAGLWVPQNEHAMPLGRLLTWGLVCLAGRQTAVPFVCSLVGPLALVIGVLLTFVFVSRERGHPLPGLVAMTLFGVTCVYQQAVFWFAASFSVLALDTLVLALLAAQRWRQGGGTLYLGLTLLATALAPAWFASGILAGPLVALYLLPGIVGQASPLARWRPWLGMLAAAIGSGLFLAVSLPRTAETILHLEHYRNKSAREAFEVTTGAVSTCRSVVDNLLPGMIGVGNLGVSLPLPAACVVLAGVVVVGAWWWRRAQERRLLLLGLGLMGCSYLLVYSARAFIPYKEMTNINWTRYHLQPQLGLALFIAGGLTLTRRASEGTLTRRQVRGVAWLIALCFCVQLPRGVVGRFGPDLVQEELLRRIEEVDARCREYHIGADDARGALPPLDLSAWTSAVNGWTFLWGSPDPRPRPPEEIRRLLGE
jgi:MFS family permease